MADFNGAGSLFVLGTVLGKLNADGSPKQGAQMCYVTDAIVKADIGLEYEDGDEITLKNGAGVICVAYQAPATLKRGTIGGYQFCAPDPNVVEFLIGGTVITESGDAIGYGAPEVGVDPTPNGVSLEFYSRAIINGAFAGYYWWTLPRAYLKLASPMSASGSDAMTPEFEGFCTQNLNWGDGPRNTWVWLSDRVWQYVQIDTLPDLTRGFRTVGAELTVTSISVTPATANLDLSLGQTQQLTVEATMSDASIRDVTMFASTDYVSSDVTKATVDDDGLISPVAIGTSTVTVTYGAQTDTCAVTVVA